MPKPGLKKTIENVDRGFRGSVEILEKRSVESKDAVKNYLKKELKKMKTLNFKD